MAVEVREFLLPDLGEGLEDAEVVTWRVAEGDVVELNQILVEVNTAKALVEIPAPWAGVIEKLHASDGDVVKVGSPLVTIRVEGPASTPEFEAEAETAGTDQARQKRRAVLVGYGVEEDAPTRPASGARGPRRGSEAPRPAPIPASPPVRRLAKELGIDLQVVEGTGQGGRVTREDVLRVADAPVEPSPPPPKRQRKRK